MAEDLLPRITQDLIKFHKEQWRAYENQRQWLILAFITFSGVLTSTYFSSGAREAMTELGMTPQGFLIFVVSVNILFCILAACADAKFAKQADAHETLSRELIEAALRSSIGDEALKQTLARAAMPGPRRPSVAALTYTGVIATNLLVVKIFALKQSVGGWYYAFVAAIVLFAGWGLLSTRKVKGTRQVPSP